MRAQDASRVVCVKPPETAVAIATLATKTMIEHSAAKSPAESLPRGTQFYQLLLTRRFRLRPSRRDVSPRFSFCRRRLLASEFRLLASGPGALPAEKGSIQQPGKQQRTASWFRSWPLVCRDTRSQLIHWQLRQPSSGSLQTPRKLLPRFLAAVP